MFLKYTTESMNILFSDLLSKIVDILGNTKFTQIRVELSNNDVYIHIDNMDTIFERIEDLNLQIFENYSFYEKLAFNKIQTFAKLRNMSTNLDKYGIVFNGTLKKYVLESNFGNSIYRTKNLLITPKKLLEIAQTIKINESAIIPAKKSRKVSKLSTIDKNLLVESRYIGQFNNEFLLVFYGNDLIIIDQHALHERILLEKLISEHKLSLDSDLTVLKSRACKGAIRFGTAISHKVAVKMIGAIKELVFPFICAHGRTSACIFTLENNKK